jgi:hypothetical protein
MLNLGDEPQVKMRRKTGPDYRVKRADVDKAFNGTQLQPLPQSLSTKYLKDIQKNY